MNLHSIVVKLNLTLHSAYWFGLRSLQLFTVVNLFHSFPSHKHDECFIFI